MTKDDMPELHRELNAVASVFGRHMSGEMAGVYFKLLVDLSLTSVVSALERFTRTAETGKRFPSPRDLRTLALETASPTRKPTESELGRIMTAANIALASWERDDGVGSARPTFERAWREACERERVLPSANDRERCWQAYLTAGEHTRGSHQWMLDDALRRETERHGGKPPRRTIFTAVLERLTKREPGEEG